MTPLGANAECHLANFDVAPKQFAFCLNEWAKVRPSCLHMVTGVHVATQGAWQAPRKRRAAAWRAALVVSALLGTACGEDTRLMFTVYGNVAADGHRLRVRAVTQEGTVAGSAVIPEDGRPLSLPGTLAVWAKSPASLVGLLLQLENQQGHVAALGRTTGCVTAAADENDLRIELRPAFMAWDTEFLSRCTCGNANARTEMCEADVIVSQDASSVDGKAANPSERPRDAAAAPVVQDAGTAPSQTDGAPATPSPTTSLLFGFERAQDWTGTQASLTLDPEIFTQGTASISFTTMLGQPVSIVSRPFATAELANPSGTLHLDIFVTQGQDFNASVQLSLHCPNAGIYEQFLTWHPLQPLAEGTWSSLRFVVPADTVAKLKQPAEGCQFRFNHQGVGTFRFDNLLFVP